jgi:carbohydrate-selective porin OprB
MAITRTRPRFRRCAKRYYDDSIRNPTLQVANATLSGLQDEWGFEAYYNAALTPWLLVTPDIQVIGGAQRKQLQGPMPGGSSTTRWSSVSACKYCFEKVLSDEC